MQAAIVDGAPADLSGTARLASLRLSRREGVLMVGEVRYTLGDHGAAFGAGAYRYSRAPRTMPADPGSGQRSGFYAMAEMPIAEAVRGWVRLGFAGAAISDVRYQLSGGIARSSPFPGRRNDLVGLAVSAIRTRSSGPGEIGFARTETNIELTYRIAVSDRFSLQPDLQYVIKPAYDRASNGVFLVGLRFGATFGN
jgi:porin